MLADISLSRGNYKEFEENLKQGTLAGSDDCREKLVRYCCGRAMKALGPVKGLLESSAVMKVPLDRGDEERLKEAASWYRKAAAAGDGESWAILARFYFFYGDILQVRERDFTKAVKQAGSSGAVQLKRLLWMYYAGPEALNGEVFHKENAKKPFSWLASWQGKDMLHFIRFYPPIMKSDMVQGKTATWLPIGLKKPGFDRRKRNGIIRIP